MAEIGAVEAVLSARDIMTPVMVDAARSVKSLQDRIRDLGQTSGVEFDTLSARLVSAQEKFNELAAVNAGAVQQALARTQASMQQTAANAQSLGTSLSNVTPAATQAAAAVGQTIPAAAATGTNAMTQMEGIAARLAVRLAILYAIRGVFQFVTNLYEGADALVKTSSALDISIHGLQVYQDMADRTGVPVNKLTEAIDTFGKKLADQKTTTEDALESIGLSFSKIFAMKPEDRINAVLGAISGMPDKLQRTKVEMVLFGTDGIDPMIKGFEALKKSSEDSNKFISDDTARQMAGTVAQFKDAWKQMKAIAADGYNAMINAVADTLNGKAPAGVRRGVSTGYPMGGEGLPGAAIDDNPSTGGGNDINLPKDNNSNIGMVRGSGISQDYIDKLAEAASGVNALTEEQVRQLTVLKDLNLLTEDNAAKLDSDGVSLDINTEKFKKFTAAMAELAKMDKAAEAYAKAWEAAEKEVADLWDNDAQSFAALAKVKAGILDDWFKYREQQDLADAKKQLDRGSITDQQYFNNKAAIERQYFDRHTETLRANEQFEITTLDDQEQKAIDKLEERYAQGKIDEEQYQQERVAITETYANKRLEVEDKFNSDMDIRRRNELDKEAQDKKDAAARAQKQAEADAAFHQRVMDAGNTSALPQLSESDLLSIYGNLDNAKARLKEIQDYYAKYPGAQTGVAGLTGLGASDGLGGNNSEGWDKLLAMQREYQQLLDALAKLNDKTGAAIAKQTTESAKSIADTVAKSQAAIQQTIKDAAKAAAEAQKQLDSSTLLSDQYSKASYEKRAKDAQDAYDFMVKHSDEYTKTDIDNARKRLDEAKKELDDWKTYAQLALDGVTGAAYDTALAIAKINEAWNDQAQSQVQSDVSKFSPKLGPNAGFTEFGEGGMVDISVGERGPEVVRAPIGSQVAPSGSSFGNQSSVVVHVNGIMDPATIRTITKAIEEAQIHKAKQQTKYTSR